MKFYKLSFDIENWPDMWTLGEPIAADGTPVIASLVPIVGPYIGPSLASIPVNEKFPGKPVDFTFGPFGLIVVKSWIGALIENMGGRIQRIPVQIDSGVEDIHEVLISLSAPRGVLDMNDVWESEFHTSSDTRVDIRYGGLAPRQRGMLYRVYPLRIAAAKAKGQEFFRPWEYTSALIVSENLKNALQREGVTGVKFTQVS